MTHTRDCSNGQMVDQTLISVVIPAHNEEQFLASQITSVLKSAGSLSIEVIVADNNSTDRTSSIAREYPDPRVRLVDASGPASASHARNRGAEAARGEILAFTDADDQIDPQWLPVIAQVMKEAGHVLVAGRLRHDEVNEPQVAAAYLIGREMGETEGVQPGSTLFTRSERGFAGYLPTCAGPNFAIRADDYRRIGGMDTSFPGGSEETDFAWRAQLAGIPVVEAPGAVVHYRLHTEPLKIFRQQRIQHRARVYLWVRYRETSMVGPSFKYSAFMLARQLAVAPTHMWTRSGRLAWAHLTGIHVGALEGIIRYRMHPYVRSSWGQMRGGVTNA